jgi:ribosomal subunit interface protein
VDIVVKARRAEVSDRFRHQVETKLAKLGRFDHKAFRVDVELSRERNPRLSGVRERVELTVFSRGPVIRAEAAATDAYAALDLATAKLTERLRRAADRRLRRHASPPNGVTSQAPAEASETTAASPDAGATDARDMDVSDTGTGDTGVSEKGVGATGTSGSHRAVTAYDDHPLAAWRDDLPGSGRDGSSSPMVVREKAHAAPPMSLDDALGNMELVGHDFYLYRDVTTGLPSVVYRRRGYDYGVIRLRTVGERDLPGDPGTPPEALEVRAAR